ncbi:conserved hypothetical protein [Tenacibaculum maritimum]|nr:conserved hypothetical protein [Tenacibaculum maritimum]CAA0257226.1 conserved hypothetical protein [Tenacibaculum maritimum]
MIMKFIKLVWMLSVFVIIVFTFVFDGVRVFDFVLGNYTTKVMKVSGNVYETYSRRKSITINGHIDKEKVYFSRFDDKIEELFSLYPGITIEENKIKELNAAYPNTFRNSNKDSKNIEVLKFKNSNIVMLTKDNEFKRWKTRLWLFSLYSMISTIILILIKKK